MRLFSFLGKTSLLRALMSPDDFTKGTDKENITDGIDITSWSVQVHEGEDINYSAWDFAGQTVYYNTHQFFLTSRAIYLLLWTTRLGYEHAGLEFWLGSIACHAPKTPIFIIGTHCDKVAKIEIPEDRLKSSFPQIIGFHYVSSISGQGISDLRSHLIDTTLQQKYMGERIPKVYLNLESNLIADRRSKKTVSWSSVVDEAVKVGLFEDRVVKEAVLFLHQLGSVQYFDKEFLRDIVVIDPQWIVDVMACVVSVKDSPINEGRFYHRDMVSVWRAYDSSMHDWLLKLTEEFDLTYEIEKDSASLVPCLLPEKRPATLFWPEILRDQGIRESKIIYSFDYLPPGLFNRMQVRLSQFSDDSAIWKKGSQLKKGDHIALLTQKNTSTIEIKAQGLRPDNLTLLIHEVLEFLIMESFQGISFDYSMPCPDCAKTATHDPAMVSLSLLQKALDFKAPFIQCQKFFHTVSLVELKTVFPSTSASDFDLQFQQTVQEMQDLKDSSTVDFFLSYSLADMPSPSDSRDKLHPKMVNEWLTNWGYTTFYSDNLAAMDTEDLILILKSSRVFLLMISANYAADEACNHFFFHACRSLRKPLLVLVVGEGMDWKQTEMGLAIGQEIYVNFQDMDLVEAKKEELRGQSLRKVPQTTASLSTIPSIFLSYCWYNSHDAVSKGTPALAGALGWELGDPRTIKKTLEKAGHQVWIDTEQAGRQGLFEDIANGMKNASVVLVCISREYASSANCMMELRFAVINLRKPVIAAIVGTSDDWMQTEAGMLLLNRAKATVIDFRDPTDIAVSKLRCVTDSQLKNSVNTKERSTKLNSVKSMHSIHELSELAQRRFLRQATRYSYEDGLALPTLMILDIDSSSDTTQPVGDPLLVCPWRILFLCEAEFSWHSLDGHPVKEMDHPQKLSLLKEFAPYLVRMYTILESTEIQLYCLQDDSKSLIAYLYSLYQESSSAKLPDMKASKENTTDSFKDAFMKFRSFVHGSQENDHELRRCILSSGKILWLCAEHRSEPNVTEISQAASGNAVHAKAVISEADIMLRDELKRRGEQRRATTQFERSNARPKMISELSGGQAEKSSVQPSKQLTFQTVGSIVGSLENQAQSPKTKNAKSKLCTIH